jgi:hypothetical protein
LCCIDWIREKQEHGETQVNSIVCVTQLMLSKYSAGLSFFWGGRRVEVKNVRFGKRTWYVTIG